MIKKLLAKNKIVQRVKAVKDLFLEKLDSLSHVQLEQIQKLEKLNQLDPLDFKVEQLNKSTEQIQQENAETKRKADLSLENQAFLLKFSVDIIKNVQVLTEKLQTNHSQSQKQHESTLDTFQKIASDVRLDSQKHSDTIIDSFQRIYEAYQQQSDAVFGTIQKIQENLHQISEDNRQIFEDIHSQKYKVIIDQQYFQDLDIELMTYLYSYLPYRLAVDIGANRGDVSSRLLQAGYQVYA
ncbi:MAG: FkbM family methyltransferase, partial [Microcystis panniformis]